MLKNQKSVTVKYSFVENSQSFNIHSFSYFNITPIVFDLQRCTLHFPLAFRWYLQILSTVYTYRDILSQSCLIFITRTLDNKKLDGVQDKEGTNV